MYEQMTTSAAHILASLLLILTASIIIAGALAKNSVKLNPWLMAACIVNLINVPF
jgi:hypothetical protein